MSIWDALPVLQNGILATLIAALVCAFLGVYVVLRRIVFMSAALSQVSSLGMAAALPLQTLIWGEFAAGVQAEPSLSAALFPIAVSLLFACSAALVMADGLRHDRRLSRECILGMVYVVPAALALLILDTTGGTVNDINNMLFGNTVVVPTVNVWMIAIAAALVTVVHGLFFKEFVFVSFDPDTAKTAGLPATRLDRLIFTSLAVMISVSIVTVGVLPVFSFMVLPPATALLFAGTLTRTFWISVLLGGGAALTGYFVSYVYSLPTGPAIIAVETVFFLSAAAFTRIKRR